MYYENCRKKSKMALVNYSIYLTFTNSLGVLVVKWKVAAGKVLLHKFFEVKVSSLFF
jgi:hypothetical protein